MTNEEFHKIEKEALEREVKISQIFERLIGSQLNQWKENYDKGMEDNKQPGSA